MDIRKNMQQQHPLLTSRLQHQPQPNALTYSMYHNLRSSFLMCRQKNQQILDNNVNLPKQHGTCYSRKRLCDSKSMFSRFKFPIAYCEEAVVQGNETQKTKSVTIPEVTDEDIQTYLTNQTGWERVRILFGKDETYHGGISPELDMIICVTSLTMFTSGLMFGRLSFYRGMEEFALINKRNHYPSRKIFRQLMHEYAMREMASKGTKVGSRVGMLTGLFMCISESIATYRGKTSMVEYCAGGAVAGSLVRWYHGIRGMALGGILGTLFGVIGGSCISLALYGIDETQEKRLYEKTKKTIETQRKVELVRTKSVLDQLNLQQKS